LFDLFVQDLLIHGNSVLDLLSGELRRYQRGFSCQTSGKREREEERGRGRKRERERERERDGNEGKEEKDAIEII
jgi:hypothetical protein